MIASVLHLDWLRATRRGRHHRLRHGYCWLLGAEAGIFLLFFMARLVGQPPLLSLALCHGFAQVLAIQHFALALLLPAAFAAGAITEEKTSGGLMLLLSTPLGPSAIIAGKWLAQVGQMLLLALPVLPLVVLVATAGGVHETVILAGIIATVVLLGALSAVGIVASVLCRRTSSAALLCYATFGLLGGAAWLLEHWGIGRWASYLDGQRWFEPGVSPLPAILTSAGVVTVTCLALAAWRLRPSYERQLTARPVGARWWWARPAVHDHQPLRWKERFVGELGLLSLVRIVPTTYRQVGVFIGTALVGLLLWRGGQFALAPVAFFTIVSLAVAVRASGVIAGERERQTWDSLLCTPQTAYQIVRGKLWGILDGARPYLAAYLLPALAVAALDGVLALLWTVFWWIATWVMMYFLGAVGLQASVGAASSWQSLLRTITMAGRLLLARWFFLLIPLGFCVNFVTMLALGGFGPGFGAVFLIIGIALTILLASLFGKTEEILQEAERLVDDDRVADNYLTVLRQRRDEGQLVAVPPHETRGRWRP